MVDSDSPPAAETDAELTARFEREAFPLLDSLYRGAVWLTGNPSEAEDLLRDTMMNAYGHFAAFPEGGCLRTALYRALTNAYLSSCRGRHRELTARVTNTVTDQEWVTAGEHPLTRVSVADVEALEALPAAAITTALQALERDTRMVVYYVDVEGFSYREIADITSRSVSTLTSLLRRGRHQLLCGLLAACREKQACRSPEDPPRKTRC
jgi:RNA polymerase sigma-70 factor, ECF subfamily